MVWQRREVRLLVTEEVGSTISETPEASAVRASPKISAYAAVPRRADAETSSAPTLSYKDP